MTSPARTLMAQARSLLRPGDTLAFATDTTSYPGREVLLALAQPGGLDLVLSIAASEWDGLKALPLLGFANAPRVSPRELIERAAYRAKGRPTPKPTR